MHAFQKINVVKEAKHEHDLRFINQKFFGVFFNLFIYLVASEMSVKCIFFMLSVSLFFCMFVWHDELKMFHNGAPRENKGLILPVFPCALQSLLLFPFF